MLEYRGVLGPSQHASIMPVLLVLAIVLPIVGAAGVLVVSRIPAAKPGMGYVALGSAALTTICAIVLALVGPAPSVPLARDGSFFVGTAPSLRYEPVVGTLALALTLATLAALLVEFSRSQEFRASLTALILCLLAASLLSLWAGDPLMLVVGWTIYDVVLCAGQLAAGVSPSGSVRTLALGDVNHQPLDRRPSLELDHSRLQHDPTFLSGLCDSPKLGARRQSLTTGSLVTSQGGEQETAVRRVNQFLEAPSVHGEELFFAVSGDLTDYSVNVYEFLVSKHEDPLQGLLGERSELLLTFP